MTMPEVPVRFGIPLELERSISVHPVGNGELYLRHYSLVWVEVGLGHYETHEYVAWTFWDRFGEEHGPIRSMDIPFNGEGELDRQGPDGDVIDIDMEASDSFDVAPEISEEDEELGGVNFEPAIEDPVPEPMEEEAVDPMDVEIDFPPPVPEAESESGDAMSSEEDPVISESSSESSGSDPDWIP